MTSIDKINNELKVYINESSFISIKCRNKLLKMFEEEFALDLDISNYQNVDLMLLDDFTFSYRDDIYKSKDHLNGDEIDKRYSSFKEKADHLLKKKEINFQNKSHFNNIINLFIILGLSLILFVILWFTINSFIKGHYYECLWLFIFVLPVSVSRIKESIIARFGQAKRYIKSLFRKLK